MLRAPVGPVATNAGISGFGMIFCNRVMQSVGGYARTAAASGAGTTVTLEFPNFQDRMHRSDQ